MVDAADLKSVARKSVRVRVPLSLPTLRRNSNKIRYAEDKLKQVAEQIYKEELEDLLDQIKSWYDCSEEEKVEAIKDFNELWNQIETIDDLIGTLDEKGYGDDAADRILRAVIEE